MTAGAHIYSAYLGAEAVAATTGYVLVDLSDTTNYPHTKTVELHVLGLKVRTEKASDGVYDLWFGVITEVDATDGSVKFFEVIHLESVHNPTDSTDRLVLDIDYTLGGSSPAGINLNITGGAATKFVSSATLADSNVWQTDTGLLSPVGAAGGTTGKPGAGDLVLYVEEVSGTGTLDFGVLATYEAF